ncbi:MAG: selenocysteine-specific translation elongation factor [Promethearchaeota archaeon]
MKKSEKIPVHIGLFGHIDSGKTAIAAVLSEHISTAGIDAHPQSKERGITIDLGFTSLTLGDYIITLIDGPGHADLIKISASSVEIIDCAMLVIDINKGPQVQTGEHLIMMESLGIKNLIVILNKLDLFKGDIQKEIEKTRYFFSTTSFGSNIPIFPVSAKERIGFDELKKGILDVISNLELKRDYEGPLIIPIDHHFPIKGRGAVITGTIISGKIKLNQNIEILPVNEKGRVKSIQMFHEDVNSAKAGDRVGVNIKNIDVKKVYRGCYATDSPSAFEYCDLIHVFVNNNKLFKAETKFGMQVHITIGMFTTAGNIYPFYEKDGKKIQKNASNKDNGFHAILWLNEKVLIRKKRLTMLISRLDLPPTTLRILGSAELLDILEEPPIFYKYKIKKGRVKNPDHTQGVLCEGLAQSAEGAKKIVGRKLEPPFSKIIGTFGTKGIVIVKKEDKNVEVKIGDPVILKELRSYIIRNY